MTTQITVETLSPITHNQIPVITTELLAQLYATKAEYIRRNHNRNEGRFIEGKHFFIAKGEVLESLKKSLRPFQDIAPNVRKLILWTERGAARHAKMLETDQAWEVFEKLEDSYFSQKQPAPTLQVEPALPFPEERRFILTVTAGGETDIRQIGPDMFVGKVSSILSGLRESGWIVIKKDMLAEKLATW
ncbi:ORF6N domain-containing protein [Salmonella enterica]|nr:ORF6N domain-containing protein [Salmonella enterica]